MSDTTVTPERERVVDRVRKLLASAASTEFTAEAEALEAKALDLITRHHIESGELSEGSTIAMRVINVSGWPGNATVGVASLWCWVAKRNRCEAYYNTGYRNEWMIVTVFGVDEDIDLLVALVNHLLVQLRADMTLYRPRSRLSFSIAWASVIGHRLDDIAAAVAVECRLPVPTNTRAADAAKAAGPIRTVRPKATDDTSAVVGGRAGMEADLGLDRIGGGS